MHLSRSDSPKLALSPDSPHPPCSPRVGLGVEQQRAHDLDVEGGFSGPRHAPAAGHPCYNNRRKSPSREGQVSLHAKKIIEGRNETAAVQSVTVCLCVAVFWLGAVMVPGYTFWYFSYARDAGNVAMRSETVDSDVVDLALFTRVMNASVPPLLARRERSELPLATVATAHDVGKTRRSRRTSHLDFGGVARRSATSRTSARSGTKSPRSFGGIVRRFATTSTKPVRPRATPYRAFDFTRSFTAHRAYPRNNIVTKPPTALSDTTLVADVSLVPSSLKPKSADADPTITTQWLSPMNEADLEKEKSDTEKAATQPSATTSSAVYVSELDTDNARLEGSSAASSSGASLVESWTSGTSLATDGTSSPTSRPFSETAETSSRTRMAFRETTRSAPTVESRGFEQARTIGHATRTADDESTETYGAEREGNSRAREVGLSDSTFAESGAESETLSTLGLAIVGRDYAVSNTTSSTELPYLVFGRRRRKSAKHGGRTDVVSQGKDEYGEHGDHKEGMSAHLKGHRKAFSRGQYRPTESAFTGRKIWKVRFTGTMRRSAH